MAFAATEKANVWTSVRIKYFTVESSRPGGRLREDRAGRGSGGDSRLLDAGMDGVDTVANHPTRSIGTP